MAWSPGDDGSRPRDSCVTEGWEERRGILFSAGAGAFFHLQRVQCIFSSAAGAFSFQRGRCILSSAVPEHLLIRQPRPLEGKTHVHRARYCSHFAAVGILSMPSATLSRQNRSRWKPFYISTGRAHENTSPSPQKMPCLRFTNCHVFASGTALPPLHEMPRLRFPGMSRLRRIIPVRKPF